MTRIAEHHLRWWNESVAYRKAYVALADEFGADHARLPTIESGDERDERRDVIDSEFLCAVCGDPVTTYHEFPSGNSAPVCLVNAGAPDCWT